MRLEPIQAAFIDAIWEANTGNVSDFFYDFTTVDDAAAWVSDAIEKHERGEKYEYAILDGIEFIGMISPRYITLDEVDIGIWITPMKQGMGYGKQALTLLIDDLKLKGVRRIHYETEPNNVPSQRLARAVGFSPVEGKEGLFELLL